MTQHAHVRLQAQGNTLRQRRRALRLTQVTIAQHLGCDPSQVQRMEMDTTRSHYVPAYVTLCERLEGEQPQSNAVTPHRPVPQGPWDALMESCLDTVLYRARISADRRRATQGDSDDE